MRHVSRNGSEIHLISGFCTYLVESQNLAEFHTFHNVLPKCKLHHEASSVAHFLCLESLLMFQSSHKLHGGACNTNTEARCGWVEPRWVRLAWCGIYNFGDFRIKKSSLFMGPETDVSFYIYCFPCFLSLLFKYIVHESCSSCFLNSGSTFISEWTICLNKICFIVH